MGTKRHIQNCRLNGPTGSIIDPSTAKIWLRVAPTVVEEADEEGRGTDIVLRNTDHSRGDSRGGAAVVVVRE